MFHSRFLRSSFVPLFAAALFALSYGSARAADPGVTSTEILLGGTHPYSGPASAYSAIGKGIAAYFAYVNDRGGVYGRKITYKDQDDAYNPPQTVQLVKAMAEQDHVFAFFGTLGTACNVAIRPYLTEQKIPDLFIATGATTWGRDAAKYPWTLGFQPDYQAEAVIFAKYILSKNPGAKIAILYQNDDFGQDYITGLQNGLGSKANQIVKTASYETTDPDVRSQMGTLQASGADTLLIAATPKWAIQAMSTLGQLSWKPATYLTNVSAAQSMMQAATKGGGDAATDGVVSDAYVMDPTSAAQAGTAGMKLYHEILAKYGKDADPNNFFVAYGMAEAYAMVDVLQKAGKDLTREKVMDAAIHLDEHNPFLWPGVLLQTSPSDRFPIRAEQLVKYVNGAWKPIGTVITARK